MKVTNQINFYVYSITCLINNKIYIGYTSNFNDRKRRHFGFLKNNNHCNHHLQAGYNLYGKHNFLFELISTCNTIEIACSEENYWCNLLKTFDRNFGYNILPTSPKPNTLVLQSKEMREKRILTMTGRKLSKSHVESLRNCRLGKKNSEDSKLKTKTWFKNNGHPSKGVKRSDETRLKIKEASKFRKDYYSKKLIVVENKNRVFLFNTTTECMTYYNISYELLIKGLNSEKEVVTKKKVTLKIFKE